MGSLPRRTPEEEEERKHERRSKAGAAGPAAEAGRAGARGTLERLLLCYNPSSSTKEGGRQ